MPASSPTRPSRGNPSQISWRSCSRFDFLFFILGRFGVISPASQAPGLAAQDKIALQILNPAQAMLADIELPGVVADDHAVAQETVGLNAAPQRAFGGDQHGVRIDLQ